MSVTPSVFGVNDPRAEASPEKKEAKAGEAERRVLRCVRG